MAKIGNEAKLILKLAETRMQDNKGYVLNGATPQAGWNKGYQDCFRDYQETLEKIVNELESK